MQQRREGVSWGIGGVLFQVSRNTANPVYVSPSLRGLVGGSGTHLQQLGPAEGTTSVTCLPALASASLYASLLRAPSCQPSLSSSPHT